ncbi:MAG: HNH endonuclease [Anaerolineaceae bacterium 4572_32.1]|nr:MAG: HNH endonuclease [Anaerolineaceae bacterium 4572_32.1]
MNEPVLVLNLNFEPLSVCALKRAMCMLVRGKASILMNGRGYVRTPSRDLPRPSVIRLGHMVHRPRPRIKLAKKEILRRDNYRCQYCGRRFSRLTVDHVIPRRLGGQHSWENVVSACPSCNSKKGGETPGTASMRLLHLPHEPVPTALYRFGSYLQENVEWRQFLEGW